jgi:hypothetical protein
MASKLTTLAQQRSSTQTQIMSRESLRWLEKKIQDLKGRSNIASQISRESDRWVNKFQLGGLYFFYYDPKTKSDLPYYDRFPLVIPLEIYPDSFLGINLHYLPVNYRLLFLDKLLDSAQLNKNDEITRVRVTYDILNATKRYKEFKPCLKKYLFGHVNSKIIAVQPNEWDIATVLPVQQFKKKSAEQVWEQSVDQIRNN